VLEVEDIGGFAKSPLALEDFFLNFFKTAHFARFAESNEVQRL
jgi:hypothetical protein